MSLLLALIGVALLIPAGIIFVWVANNGGVFGPLGGIFFIVATAPMGGGSIVGAAWIWTSWKPDKGASGLG
jgi:hypothetical protein